MAWSRYTSDHPTAIAAKIDEIDRRFALIMITEYMDESLVLLRQLLCWDWDDIVVFRVNARKSQYKTVSLPDELKEKIRAWNAADHLLYQHFPGAI